MGQKKNDMKEQSRHIEEFILTFTKFERIHMHGRWVENKFGFLGRGYIQIILL